MFKVHSSSYHVKMMSSEVCTNIDDIKPFSWLILFLHRTTDESSTHKLQIHQSKDKCVDDVGLVRNLSLSFLDSLSETDCHNDVRYGKNCNESFYTDTCILFSALEPQLITYLTLLSTNVCLLYLNIVINKYIFVFSDHFINKYMFVLSDNVISKFMLSG